jgi:hypothetical protein
LKRALTILDDLSAEELGAKIKECDIVAPDTSIGPTDLNIGYEK